MFRQASVEPLIADINFRSVHRCTTYLTGKGWEKNTIKKEGTIFQQSEESPWTVQLRQDNRMLYKRYSHETLTVKETQVFPVW